MTYLPTASSRKASEAMFFQGPGVSNNQAHLTWTKHNRIHHITTANRTSIFGNSHMLQLPALWFHIPNMFIVSSERLNIRTTGRLPLAPLFGAARPPWAENRIGCRRGTQEELACTRGARGSCILMRDRSHHDVELCVCDNCYCCHHDLLARLFGGILVHFFVSGLLF